jgi:hypothetical protein
MDSKDTTRIHQTKVTTTTQAVTTTVLNIQTRGGARTVSPTHLLRSLSVAGVSLGLAMDLAAVDCKELAASCFPDGRTQVMEFVSSVFVVLFEFNLGSNFCLLEDKNFIVVFGTWC